MEALSDLTIADKEKAIDTLRSAYAEWELRLDGQNKKLLQQLPVKIKSYKSDFYIFKVRDKEIKIQTWYESLSHTRIPKVAVPDFEAWGEQLKWMLQENFPGEFPFTAGIFPFKREGEDPTECLQEKVDRKGPITVFIMFLGMPAHRLSTAFDSVTLYGHDPDYRPDIYGKIGNRV
jgi:methylmalonyl-CoA mutase